ncbi:MAG TPA: Fe-S cluster assembly protein SufD [Terracidiphilus sp.]|nr:Fe-S cluster assembly protein SufD [Terracidiphilus sp.]
MATEIAQVESYLKTFTDFRTGVTAETPRWLSDLRDAGFARFCETGFPTIRDEDWRFTNLSAVVRTPFVLAGESTQPVTADELEKWRIDGIAQMVFVDGRFCPGLSKLGALPNGVTLSSLHQEILQGTERVREHLGRYLNIQRDPFCALNTAFVEDGAYIHVSRGVALEQPIHLLFISTSGGAPVMTHPRNLILLEAESEAAIVEEYVSIGKETPIFSNVVTEFVAGSNSTVSHTMIEREHLQSYNFSTLRIEQARSANVASHSLLLGGALVRNNVHPVLTGEGGECLINGLFVGAGHQVLDNYMLVEHVSPHCASRQFYNGILDERAHGVFHGRIIVHKDAQKTDAKQTNRNLLLADDAQIDTKPQLEIYADDVKCTHGATIGQIDEDALFYLRSRGISEAEARRILLQAFAAECLDRMKAGAARDYCEALIMERLASISSVSAQPNDAIAETRKRNWEEVG